MKIKPLILGSAFAALALLLGTNARAQVGSIAPRFLFDPSSPKAASLLTPSSDQVTSTPGKDGITVDIAAGKEDYPGLSVAPEGDTPWDLTPFGHVEAKITNLGKDPISVALRVDNSKDGSSCNSESVSLKPGDSRVLKVIFGYGYGGKPGFKLNPGSIVQLLFFSHGNKNAPRSFRIEDIQASGSSGEKPPVNPEYVRVVPQNGLLLGNGLKIDAAQVVARAGATATITPAGALQIDFVGGPKHDSVTFKPAIGSWILTDALQVQVKIKNTGDTPATPSFRLSSKGGDSSTITSAAIPPGGEAIVTIPFAAAVTSITPTDPKQEVFGKGSWSENNWSPEAGTGTKFVSDGVKGVSIIADSTAGAKHLLITAIGANVPPTPTLPAWLGQRPPIAGDWVQTLNENFTGTAIDLNHWNIYSHNYWDKRTHFTKDDAIVKDGFLTLHYEKKTGFQNDDPKGKQTDYACGYADTFGKWHQRYGYFEARVKLPRAPGLWPAFWLMPDRGPAAGPDWARSSTAKGGMEQDILEFLSGWGPYRYNIAFHWDGYGKEHKATGSTNNYIQPDKDGFITAGVYWVPGLVVVYSQGKEVFRWASPRVSNVPSFILLDMVSGGWDNQPLEDTKLPDDFVIDYIHVWQRKDLASAADGPIPNSGLPSSVSADK